MELWFSHSVCICFVYNHSSGIDMVKFFNDALYYTIIALILMGFMFFLVGMLSVTLVLGILEWLYVRLGFRSLVHYCLNKR
jgi:uncharacterized membrane protein YedE/YeeE